MSPKYDSHITSPQESASDVKFSALSLLPPPLLTSSQPKDDPTHLQTDIQSQPKPIPRRRRIGGAPLQGQEQPITKREIRVKREREGNAEVGKRELHASYSNVTCTKDKKITVLDEAGSVWKQGLNVVGEQGNYVAGLFIPRQTVSKLREWKVVFTLCPCNAELFLEEGDIIEQLQQLMQNEYETKFEVDAKPVHFIDNELRLQIPFHEARDQGYKIFPPISSKITQEEVKVPEHRKQWSKQIRANHTYPPRIILRIRPNQNCVHNELNCKLHLRGCLPEHSFTLFHPEVIEHSHTPHDSTIHHSPMSVESHGAARTPFFPASTVDERHQSKQSNYGSSQSRMYEDRSLHDRNDKLNEVPDIRTLMNEVAALSKAPANWIGIGYQLGLKLETIRHIEHAVQISQDLRDGFRRVFEEWERMVPKRTWRMVIAALDSKHVGEYALARSLEHHLLTK